MGPQPGSCGRAFKLGVRAVSDELQWGRNLAAAEGLPTIDVGPLKPMLQWGRSLAAAEGGELSCPAPPVFRFNGAATWQLRKVAAGHSRPRFCLGLNGAATWQLRKADAADAADMPDATSTGPQPGSCGRQRPLRPAL